MENYPQPYKSPLPHPSKVVPKVVLVVFALCAFGHLFYKLAQPQEIPHPIRLGLLHAEIEQDAFELLRSGMVLPAPLELALAPTAGIWDQPLGTENAGLTYNARAFREVDHLGDDLNGIGGEDSDLGDPIYAIGDGVVIFAGEPAPAWGKIVILQHRNAEGEMFQTFYAHLDQIYTGVESRVSRGQKIGTVGTANGKWLAHLHFEWRSAFNLDVGDGYSPFPLDREPGEKKIGASREKIGAFLLPSLYELEDLSNPEKGVEMGNKAGKFQFLGND